MTKKPIFYPIRFIRSEWGTALGIYKKGYTDSLKAMQMAYRLAESEKEFMENYSIATLEGDRYIPIPDGTATMFKKEVCR